MNDHIMEEEIEYKYVLGQDPGGTTGVAVLRYTEHTKPELVYLHQIPDGREGFFYFFIGTEVGEGTNVVSVSEKWEQREGVHGANLEPVRIEGVQDAIWVFQTHYQSPSVKPMIGDEFLKVNNLWTEGKRHQMDALLHAIYYLRSIGHEPTLKALSGELGEELAEPGEADAKTLPGGAGEGEGGAEIGEGLAESATTAAEAMEKFAEAVAWITAEQGKDDSEGDGGGGEHVDDGADYQDDGKVYEKQRKRSLNGAFIGFEDDDE